jgi:hypothetical protein
MSTSKLICSVVLLKSSFRIAAATVSVNKPLEWKMCAEVVVPASLDHLIMLEQFLVVLGTVDRILVYQAEARSSLLHRHAHDMVVMVDQPSSRNRALWPRATQSSWTSRLLACWQAADMIFSHVRRFNHSAPLNDTRGSSLHRECLISIDMTSSSIAMLVRLDLNACKTRSQCT